MSESEISIMLNWKSHYSLYKNQNNTTRDQVAWKWISDKSQNLLELATLRLQVTSLKRESDLRTHSCNVSD